MTITSYPRELDAAISPDSPAAQYANWTGAQYARSMAASMGVLSGLALTGVSSSSTSATVGAGAGMVHGFVIEVGGSGVDIAIPLEAGTYYVCLTLDPSQYSATTGPGTITVVSAASDLAAGGLTRVPIWQVVRAAAAFTLGDMRALVAPSLTLPAGGVAPPATAYPEGTVLQTANDPLVARSGSWVRAAGGNLIRGESEVILTSSNVGYITHNLGVVPVSIDILPHYTSNISLRFDVRRTLASPTATTAPVVVANLNGGGGVTGTLGRPTPWLAILP